MCQPLAFVTLVALLLASLGWFSVACNATPERTRTAAFFTSLALLGLAGMILCSPELLHARSG